MFAERGSRETSDTGLFEQRVGQFLRRPARLRNVGEGVERAFRHAAGETLDLVQPGDEDVASAFELGAHFVDRRLVSAKRFNPGNLREAGGAGGGVGGEWRDRDGEI